MPIIYVQTWSVVQADTHCICKLKPIIFVVVNIDVIDVHWLSRLIYQNLPLVAYKNALKYAMWRPKQMLEKPGGAIKNGQMLEKTESAITNGHSKDTCNIGHK